MCKVANCELWCLRLSHWGVDWQGAECPKGCTVRRVNPQTKQSEMMAADRIDCIIAPGICCGVCGAYWVPNLTPEIVEALAIEYKHGPKTPPTEAQTRIQFQQYADMAWRHMTKAAAA